MLFYASVDGVVPTCVHGGKTRVWNSAGIRPLACDIYGKSRKPRQTMLNRCGEIPICPPIKVLGTPLGHADFVRAHLDRKVEEHQELLRRIPTVPDLQLAWLLLLHCAAAKAT